MPKGKGYGDGYSGRMKDVTGSQPPGKFNRQSDSKRGYPKEAWSNKRYSKDPFPQPDDSAGPAPWKGKAPKRGC